MGLLARPLLCTALLACGDPLFAPPADRPAPAVRPPPPPRYLDCLDALSESDERACLVIDDFRTVLLFGPDSGRFCDPALRLSLDHEGKAAWIADELLSCATHGLTRALLSTGETETLVGLTCLDAVEIDGGLLLRRSAEEIEIYDGFEGARLDAARTRFRVSFDPWPNTLTAGYDRMYWSRDAMPTEVAWSSVLTFEQGSRAVPPIGYVKGLEVLSEGMMVALVSDPGAVSLVFLLDSNTGMNAEQLQLDVQLTYPELVDCRSIR